MLFNIENDSGDCLIGYIVPDTLGGIPDIEVLSGNRLLLSMPANEVREALITAGRHESGRCGFRIGAESIEGLAGLDDLVIVEKSTGLRIYRRPRPGQIARKILRLETSLFPFVTLDNQIGRFFQYAEKGLERFGLETVTQMFMLHAVPSVYLSGRIAYGTYAAHIEEGFDVLCLVQDPYDEFAERLIILAKLSEIGAQYLGPRDGARMAPAIEFAASLDLDHHAALRRALRAMPADVASLLSNPLVRQFTATTPDDMPGPAAVATTLDILSRCAAVSTRTDGDGFIEMIGAHLGIDTETLPVIRPFPKVGPCAQALREMRIIDHLIEADLEVYAHIEDAIEAGA
jgi:hypothetical protein